jgi:pimeloyl-ACP methyl ester carboxylesterase
MEMMAEMVRSLLRKLRIGKATLVGHSMGGYVALSLASAFPSLVSGVCLFHSHCFADTEAERENRDRTISIIRNDGFGFVAQFIPGLFPNEVHRKLSGEIEKLIRRASRMDNDALIAALEGMKIRPDHAEWLRKTKMPVLFIIGQKDSRAPLSRLMEMISLPARSELLLLRDCGHMGYLEQPAVCLRAIESFARKSG